MKEGPGSFACTHSTHVIQSAICQALLYVIVFPGNRLCGSSESTGGFLGTVLRSSIRRVVKEAGLGREEVNYDTVTS